jgi:hypothetical protein
MNKIAALTDEQYNRLRAGKLGKELRELLKIPLTKKMRIGDTVCMVGQTSQAKDVFRSVQSNGREVFYIVVEPLNDIMAMCYSIYPV